MIPAVVLLSLTLTQAVPPTPDSPYEVKWARDLSIAGVAAVAWVTPLFVADQLVDKSCPCGRSNVWAIDRVALDRSSRGAKVASDLMVGTIVGLPVLLDALDVRVNDGPWSSLLPDVVVMGQAVLLSGAFNGAVKLAVNRPRPYARDLPAGDPRLQQADAYLSFYSGHSSAAFAAGMSYASTFAYRHPDSAWRWAVFAGAGVSGATVGALRIAAGKHFPTDVFTGAVAGTAIGLAVPWWHRKTSTMPGAIVPVVQDGGVAVIWTGLL